MSKQLLITSLEQIYKDYQNIYGEHISKGLDDREVAIWNCAYGFSTPHYKWWQIDCHIFSLFSMSGLERLLLCCWMFHAKFDIGYEVLNKNRIKAKIAKICCMYEEPYRSCLLDTRNRLNKEKSGISS
jgi:hypothetical protein